MEWFRSLETIEGLEEICKHTAQLVHDGKKNGHSDFHTRTYRFWTSAIDYTNVKFIYNHRKGEFSVKFSIEKMLDLLVALKNKSGEINLPSMKITKQGTDIKIFDK